MSRLPVITGFGGINPAGRSSFHHAFHRIILDSLSENEKNQTSLNLASLMGLVYHENGQFFDKDKQPVDPAKLPDSIISQIKEGTLLRRLSAKYFDPDAMLVHKSMKTQGDNLTLAIKKRDLPNSPPKNWKITDLENGDFQIEVKGDLAFLHQDYKTSPVSTAGQLPAGFNPGEEYNSRNHPRALQMTVYGASDALGSMGIPLDAVKKLVRPEEIGVYAGNAMGQLDDEGIGGYLKSPYMGKRTSSKQMPFSFAEMPGDFINAYILGSLGHTGATLGACATFLYNLDIAVKDIQSGKRRFAMVGTSEAPLVPEVFEGYRVMSALAEDAQILKLDAAKGATKTDHTTACRPFGYNCGFTLAEASEFVILMDDELALELGAQIFGAVGEVFVNADGFKKSISAPGAGNYLTIARAAASAQAILGQKGLREKTFLHAHGTGTPQNRVTESHAFNEVAKAFGIESWPLAAIKCYLGHSIGSAAGSQLMASLGTWNSGILPGIFTLDEIANDVHHSNLSLSKDHREFGKTGLDAALLNSKGFGGNNATAVILAPHVAEEMLTKKHGEKAMVKWKKKREAAIETANAWDEENTKGNTKPVYQFGEGVLEDEDIQITEGAIKLTGFEKETDLKLNSPYPDMNIKQE